jgi:hypothetical protein
MRGPLALKYFGWPEGPPFNFFGRPVQYPCAWVA